MTLVRLIQNENIKIYRQLGTQIMIGLLIIGLILSALSSLYTREKFNEQKLKQAIEQGELYMQQEGITASQKKSVQRKIDVLKLQLENKWGEESVDSFIGIMNSASFISLMTMIVAAGIVGKEFSEGTMKLLLTRPSPRWLILLSKYMTVILFGISMLVLQFVISSIVMSIFFKPALWSLTWIEILTSYGYDSIRILFFVTLAFMLSTVFRSSATAIGVSLFSYFIGNLVTFYVSKYAWAKYLLFSNLNLSRYPMVGGEEIPVGFQGMTLSFSIIVLIVYYLLFMGTSFYVFRKRDVSI